MQSQIKLSTAVQELLRCPICRKRLDRIGEQFFCINSECGAHFPIIDGIPVLLNEDSSLFSIDDFVSQRSASLDLRESKIKKVLRQSIPSINRNVRGKQNYDKLAKLLLSQSTAPRVLVVGCGSLGQGMESLLLHRSIELIESDVSFGPRIMLVCDAHDIPFENDSFDAITRHFS